MLFDPYQARQNLFNNTVFDEELEIDCLGSTRNVLRKFCPLRTESAMNEVLTLTTMEWIQNAEATMRQECVNQSIPDRQALKSEVEKTMWKQNRVLPTKNLWRSIGQAHHDYLP